MNKDSLAEILLVAMSVSAIVLALLCIGLIVLKIVYPGPVTP